MGQILCSTVDRLQAESAVGLSFFLDRLRSEITRLSPVQAPTKVAGDFDLPRENRCATCWGGERKAIQRMEKNPVRAGAGGPHADYTATCGAVPRTTPPPPRNAGSSRRPEADDPANRGIHARHGQSNMHLAETRSRDLDEQCPSIFNDLVDDVILRTCFKVHRSVKLGLLFLDEAPEDERKYEIVDEVGLDVFGQVPLKKQFECVCPNCQRNLAGSRFEPPLEKCMAMRRNSSWIASKRITNTGRAERDVDDYDNDTDWNYLSDMKPSKKRKDRNSLRKIKGKPKNGRQSRSSSATEQSNSISTYESLSIEERKALLTQMCGVISEHTKKMGTRSQHCPQHKDKQREVVRQFLLNQSAAYSTHSADRGDEVHIDVDTFDESDNHSLHDTIGQMWENVSSTNSSPADGSFQGNNGAVGGKKKDKRSQHFGGSSLKKPNKSRPGSSSTADPVNSDLL